MICEIHPQCSQDIHKPCWLSALFCWWYYPPDSIFTRKIRVVHAESMLFRGGADINIGSLVLSCNIVYCLAFAQRPNVHIENLFNLVYIKYWSITGRKHADEFDTLIFIIYFEICEIRKLNLNLKETCFVFYQNLLIDSNDDIQHVEISWAFLLSST